MNKEEILDLLLEVLDEVRYYGSEGESFDENALRDAVRKVKMNMNYED